MGSDSVKSHEPSVVAPAGVAVADTQPTAPPGLTPQSDDEVLAALDALLATDTPLDTLAQPPGDMDAGPSGSPIGLTVDAPAATKAALTQHAAGLVVEHAASAPHPTAAMTDVDVASAPEQTWDASPAEVASLVAHLTGGAAGLAAAGDAQDPTAVADVLAAERHLYAASCPELGDSLDQLRASATLLLDDRVAATGDLAQQLIDTDVITPDARWLNPAQALALARPTSPTADLAHLATDRSLQVAELNAAGVDWATTGPDIDALTAETGPDLVAWLDHNDDVAEHVAAVGEWSPYATTSPQIAFASSPDAAHTAVEAKTTAFRAWAKQQPLKQLRAAAKTAGLDDPTNVSTRAQVTNFLASHFNANLDVDKIQTAVTDKASKKTAASNTGTATGSISSTATAPPGSVAAAANAYLGSLGQLKAKLRSHQALASDLPSPVATSVVAGHDWGTGTTFSAGSHESTLHTGPDGGQWMFKPDKSANGARAHAEAAANTICRRVGIASVQVEVVDIGGRRGAIQPLVPGATQLSHQTPSSWTQTDVDAAVAMHVASWAVGDHDAHGANVLRSPSGAIFGIDRGQAFKFLGRDKLTPDWHPTTNHGQPIYQRLYAAHTAGSLTTTKVRAKAALPVLKAFEAIDDTTYRSLLSTTATEGVKHRVGWVPTIRKAAATRHGVNNPTDQQIADEFLDQAIARKNSLRSDFATLFGGLGVDDAAHLDWVN